MVILNEKRSTTLRLFGTYEYRGSEYKIISVMALPYESIEHAHAVNKIRWSAHRQHPIDTYIVIIFFLFWFCCSLAVYDIECVGGRSWRSI